MASKARWSNQKIGAIARRIRTNEPSNVNADAFVRIARQMRDEYEVDRTRLNNELADTLTALAAALTLDSPPTVPLEVRAAIQDLIRGIRSYNAYAYAKEINAVIDWLNDAQGKEF